MLPPERVDLLKDEEALGFSHQTRTLLLDLSLFEVVGIAQLLLKEVAEGRVLREVCRGEAQNLKDREILEFLGEETG